MKEREAITARESGGRLGYLHLNAMNDANLEKFKRAVFGDMQEKEGLVLDVRFNGGGAIADEILAILQDRVFGLRTVRGDPNRLPAPLQVWTKPTIVLINEAYKAANPDHKELHRWLDQQLETFDRIYSGKRPRYIEGYNKLKEAIRPWGT